MPIQVVAQRNVVLAYVDLVGLGGFGLAVKSQLSRVFDLRRESGISVKSRFLAFKWTGVKKKYFVF